MKNLDDLFGSVQSRIAAGLILVGALLWGLPVSENAVFDLKKAIVIATASGAWVWAEIKSISIEPNPHDQKLFKKSHELFDVTIANIAEHDFGNSFNHAMTKPFIEFVDQWKGPSFMFVDKKVNVLWIDFATKAQNFTQELVERSGYLPNSNSVLTVKSYEDLRKSIRSEQTLAAANALNDSADDVALAWSKFVAVSLKRLQTSVG